MHRLRNSGHGIFQTPVQVTLLVNTCLWPPTLNQGRGGHRKGSCWVFILFQSTRPCSILQHPKRNWNPRRNATSLFFSLGDFPIVIQAPGFLTSYRIISTKCSLRNRGRVPRAMPTSELPLCPNVALGSSLKLLGSTEHSWEKKKTHTDPRSSLLYILNNTRNSHVPCTTL